MFGIGGQELLLILILGLIILGPKRLPELARFLGKAMGELQRTADQIKRDIDVTIEPDDKGTNHDALDLEASEGSSNGKHSQNLSGATVGSSGSDRGDAYNPDDIEV